MKKAKEIIERIKEYFITWFLPFLKLTDEQVKLRTIINVLCQDNSTIFSNNPITGKLFLRNELLGYDVILDNNEVFINNHNIFMSYNIDGGFMHKLKSIVYHTIAEKTNLLERDMMNKKTIAINKIVNVL
jgi:hypothetical protein